MPDLAGITPAEYAETAFKAEARAARELESENADLQSHLEAMTADRDEAWKVAAARRNEARRYYVAWSNARMRAQDANKLAASLKATVDGMHTEYGVSNDVDPNIFGGRFVGNCSDLDAARRVEAGDAEGATAGDSHLIRRPVCREATDWRWVKDDEDA